MARKKRLGEELMVRKLTEQRYNNPQDPRIYKQLLKKVHRRLGGQT